MESSWTGELAAFEVQSMNPASGLFPLGPKSEVEMLYLNRRAQLQLVFLMQASSLEDGIVMLTVFK